jgi:Lrp/AsnC family leucine-responsive transcriptional regulator
MIDAIDREILSLLRANSCTPKAEIARRVGLTPTAVFERIRKLEERGVIAGYHAHLDPKAFGRGLLAFVFVTGDYLAQGTEMGSTLAAIPGVEEAHVIAGEDCFLLKVRAADTEALYRLLRQHIASIPSVRGTRTTIVLETLTEDGQVPLTEAEDEAPEETSAALRPTLRSLVEKRYQEAG